MKYLTFGIYIYSMYCVLHSLQILTVHAGHIEIVRYAPPHAVYTERSGRFTTTNS